MASASRLLFLLSGVVWALVGLLTLVMSQTEMGRRTLLGSPSTDVVLYGAPPSQLLTADPALSVFRRSILPSLAGLLVSMGLVTAGVAWYGMRDATWSLALLTVVGLVVLPFWWIAFRPYRQAGIAVGLFDLPLFMWVPGVLMPLAAVLGWVSQLQGR